jgi:hypothetical protein
MTTLRSIPVLFVLFVTSCAPSKAGVTGTVSPALPATETPIPATATAPLDEPATLPAVTPLPMDMIPPEGGAMVARVQIDLATRLSAPPDATMTLLSAEAITWPDASLGCPLPKTDYIQVKTPGFIITLLANGGRYTYHTDIRDNYVICREGRAENPKSEDGNVQDGWPSQPIEGDLVPPPTLTR